MRRERSMDSRNLTAAQTGTGMDMSETSSFARPTSSALLGKQTATLKTSTTDEFADLFSRWARERGFGSSSDCMREVLYIAVLGPDWLIDLHRQRIASLSQNLSGIGAQPMSETTPSGTPVEIRQFGGQR